jgi:hypothetical protein
MRIPRKKAFGSTNKRQQSSGAFGILALLPLATCEQAVPLTQDFCLYGTSTAHFGNSALLSVGALTPFKSWYSSSFPVPGCSRPVPRLPVSKATLALCRRGSSRRFGRVVKEFAATAGLGSLAPFDLRSTRAFVPRGRWRVQKLRVAVNDHIGIKPD